MRTVFINSKKALSSLVSALLQLPSQAVFSMPCAALSNATVGQHTRHIIELYQCLLIGYKSGTINYDDRKRNKFYENDIAAAIDAVEDIKLNLEQADKEVNIFCGTDENAVSISSNYFREVLYNLEHCIHHQALIKVALLTVSGMQVAGDFGVAPSTLEYRKQCAQ